MKLWRLLPLLVMALVLLFVACEDTDDEDEPKEPVYHLYNSDNSDLPYNAVYCIDFDQQGNIWFGGQKNDATGTANVSMLSNGLTVWTVYGQDDIGLGNMEDRAFYIAIDDQNTKWFCTHYGVGYLKSDGTSGEVDFTVDAYTRSVQVDSEGTVYISDRDAAGIWVSTDHGANWTLWEASDIGLTTGRPEIYDLREADDGTMWICTWYGLTYRDPSGTWHSVTELEDLYTYAMTVDLEGNAWTFVNDLGADLYKVTTGGAVTAYDSTDLAILNMPLNDLEFDRLGGLWLATDGSGLVKVNVDDMSYTVYDSVNTEDQIPEDNITHMEIYDDKIWMSGATEGIFMVENLIDP